MTVRPVAANDWPRVGVLAESLVRAHHAFDAFRFIDPGSLPASVYTSRVQAEIARGRATLQVAESNGEIVGFVFAGIEPESWKELRPEAGFVQDLVVAEGHRDGGIGSALLASAIEWFDTRGVQRIMLWTAQENAGAQRLFNSVGFRPTMIEMTLDRRR
jgi:GNAT superfamily N-acetyltransferase